MPRPKKIISEETIKQPSKNYFLILVTLAFFVVVGFVLHKNLYQQTQTNEEKTAVQEIAQNPIPQDMDQKVSYTPRENVLNSIPFTPQAPTANWDELHNDACEEASSIMVASYFSPTVGSEKVPIKPEFKNLPSSQSKEQQLLDPKFVEQEITRLTKWQDQNFGYHLSIDTYETAQMISEVYNLQAKVVPFSIETIKQTYAQTDKLIIIPANGQLLGNPYFKAPGPKYHMLVISGFNKKEFITNDPGTKRGYNYAYEQSELEKAVGNWDHKQQQVDLTNKLMIIVSAK